MKRARRRPKIVLENGEPKAVILDIEEYRRILERLDDVEDLKRLQAIRRRGVKYRRLSDFLREYDPRV